jgi:hypothetical protein
MAIYSMSITRSAAQYPSSPRHRLLLPRLRHAQLHLLARELILFEQTGIRHEVAAENTVEITTLGMNW